MIHEDCFVSFLSVCPIFSLTSHGPNYKHRFGILFGSANKTILRPIGTEKKVTKHHPPKFAFCHFCLFVQFFHPFSLAQTEHRFDIRGLKMELFAVH